jgi:hypothetical protein
MDKAIKEEKEEKKEKELRKGRIEEAKLMEPGQIPRTDETYGTDGAKRYSAPVLSWTRVLKQSLKGARPVGGPKTLNMKGDLTGCVSKSERWSG